MKTNLPVTNLENDYDSTLRIVSTTNLKGVVTYANKDFIKISGFSEDELLGQSHNIVRHPDMPQEVFQDLWDNIKKGNSWMGIVKNRCKNGEHYWADAFVTPLKNGSETIGFQSVRIKPTKKLIHSAKNFYQHVNKGIPAWKKALSKISFGLLGKMVATNITVGVVVLLLTNVLGVSSLISIASILGLIVVVSFGLSKLVANPWQKAAQESKAVFSNSVAQKVYTQRDDELGQLQLVIKMLQLQQETLVLRIGDAAGNLQSSSSSSAKTSSQIYNDMCNQSEEAELVATAMNEMTATVHEVARNTSSTADATLQAQKEVEKGHDIVEKMVTLITQLSQRIEKAVTVISILEQSSNEIQKVIEVIRGIAEQTNLLALNAAIEAARAGEQGRGFAVVADEVRTLASRSQGSTHEIQKIIEELQQNSEQAVSVMKTCQVSAAESVEEAVEAGDSLKNITHNVEKIIEKTTQIATAAEQQSSVAEEINRNITRINDVTSHTMGATKKSLVDNEALVTEIKNLRQIVTQFGCG